MGAIALVINVFNSTVQNGIYSPEEFSVTNSQGITSTLQSGHTVSVMDGSGITHYYSFSDEIVTSGVSRRSGLGGAGYGGVTPFEEFNARSVEASHGAGCAIANNVMGHNPNLMYTISWSNDFDERLADARQFKATYCPLTNG